MWVNYRLHSDIGQQIYINGRWTTEGADTYRMLYDPANHLYTACILQKQGYYSYQYLCDKEKQLPSEGSYYQTENHYQGLIYYKGTSDRTWRLIAYHDTPVE